MYFKYQEQGSQYALKKISSIKPREPRGIAELLA